MKTIILNETNSEMPLVGLGTWQSVNVEEIKSAVRTALNLGYRSIDTAFNYNNEEAIGKAINEWIEEKKGKRNELFITTKLPHIGNRASDVEKFLRLSLSKLNLTYVDLYLIHVPFGFELNESTMSPKVDGDGQYILDLNTDHINTWKAMEQVMQKGLTKNIGLSNFNEKQIDLIYNAATIKPQVLQIECHLYLQQKSLREYCKGKNIAVTAYSPLGSPGAQKHFSSKYNYELQNFPDIIGHSVVKAIADKHDKSPSQVLLKYLVHHQVAVIPKSTNPDRLKKNIQLFDFDLSSEDKESLEQLDHGEHGRIIDFLFWKGVTNHPQYPFSNLP